MTETRPTTERPRRTAAYPRHALRCPVRVSGIDPEIDPESGLPCFTSVEEHALNLSEGGVFVPGDDTLTPGRRVLVEIDLPDLVDRVGDRREVIVGHDAEAIESHLGAGAGHPLQFCAAQGTAAVAAAGNHT